MSSTDKQGSSLGSFPTSPPLYPHFNRPSGFWPCVKSCLVGGSDKYSAHMVKGRFMMGPTHESRLMRGRLKNSWPCRHFSFWVPQTPSNKVRPASRQRPPRAVAVQRLNSPAWRDEFMPFSILVLIIFTNPSARAGYDTRSIFKRSLTGLNSEFSFS